MNDSNQELTTPATLSPSEAEAQAESVHIGAFSAYIRRPVPTKSGMLAQFFGEDGEDADTITALSLTRYVDSDVLLDVFLIKDEVGRSMKNAAGHFNKISSFKAKILRPKPTKSGMLAQFFATDGDDADRAIELGYSKLQDCLVFVEVKKPEDAEEEKSTGRRADQTDTSFLAPQMDEASQKLTPNERKAVMKRAKAWDEAAKQLKLSGFLRAPAVWQALAQGDEGDFREWASHWKCCANLEGGHLCSKEAEPFRLAGANAPTASRPFEYVPLCPDHTALAEQGLSNIQGGEHYLRARQTSLVQEWAWERLKEAAGALPEMSAPDPQQVAGWAAKHKVSHLLPRALLMNVV